jgi:hypothetical protein
MEIFSSWKKASKPTSNVANKLRGLVWDSNTSGKACKSEEDSMMPTDRLTIRPTIFDNRAKEKNCRSGNTENASDGGAQLYGRERGINLEPLVPGN